MGFWQLFALQFHVSIAKFILRQDHSHCHIGLSTKCELVLPLPFSTIYAFTHRILKRKHHNLHLRKGDKSA